MLHSSTSRGDAATLFACAIISAFLIFIVALEPAGAQIGGRPTFEGRFFFQETPAILPPRESAPPRTTVIQRSAPTGSGPAPGMVQQAPSAAHSLFFAPAAAAAAPFRKTQVGQVTATKPVAGGGPIGTGRAAWYEHPGRTASGETFDPDRLTAAHKSLPFGTRLRVVNLQNRRAVVVRVNDRIPKTTKTITIDLSRGSARAIGIEGIGRVALYPVDGPQ
jgi:rare lipoprotein A